MRFSDIYYFHSPCCVPPALASKQFLILKATPCTVSSIPLSSQSLETTSLPSVPMDLPILNISRKWNNMRFGLLCLDSFYLVWCFWDLFILQQVLVLRSFFLLNKSNNYAVWFPVQTKLSAFQHTHPYASARGQGKVFNVSLMLVSSPVKWR